MHMHARTHARAHFWPCALPFTPSISESHMLAPPCTRMQAAFSLYFWKRLEVHYCGSHQRRYGVCCSTFVALHFTGLCVLCTDVPELEDIVIAKDFWHKDFLEVMKKEFSNPEYRGHFSLDACEKRSPSGARLIDDPQDAGKYAAPRLPLTSCVICCSLNTPDMHRPLDVFSAASAQLHQVP